MSTSSTHRRSVVDAVAAANAEAHEACIAIVETAVQQVAETARAAVIAAAIAVAAAAAMRKEDAND
jgi:hypothetical protein